MRRLMMVGVATLMACGAPTHETPPPSTSSWSTAETAGTRARAPVRISAPGPVVPRLATLPPGSWVRDEVGTCVEREDWLVIAENGELDHVLADRNACGESRLSRFVGRWSTDNQVARMWWANRQETVTREVTYWAVEDDLQIGAYVPVDGGWWRRDAVEREVGGSTLREAVDVGLRIDDLELRDGAGCRMSATVTATLDGAEATEVFELGCVVERDGDVFAIVADGMWQDGGWRGHLERQGVFARHGSRLGSIFFEGFQPVFHTADGDALWHERADSVYRFTEEVPPVSADELMD